MTPADLDRHTAETRELLKDASRHKVTGPANALHPYEAGSTANIVQKGPITFASAFMWSKEIEPQRQAWQHLTTGFKAALSEVYPDCTLMWSEFNIPSPAHVAIVLGQYYAKMRRALRGNLIYVEVDVVCNKRCDPFEADFDIGIPDCKDQWAMMPFNPGVMFVKDTPGAQRFLDTAMEYACHIPGNFPSWYAYQMALGCAWQALKDEVNIKIFPNEEYNWSPDVYAPSDAYFIHLKGARKQMQRDYIVPLIEGRRGQIMVPK